MGSKMKVTVNISKSVAKMADAQQFTLNFDTEFDKRHTRM